MATSASPIDAVALSPSPPLPGAMVLVGRVLLAAIFVMSGLGKIADPVNSMAYITDAGLPAAPLGLAAAIMIEVGAGFALILGYRTRLAAAALALFSVVAALLFHSDFSDQNQIIHFSKNLAMVGGLMQVVAFGGGRLSLDARLRRDRSLPS